MNFRHMFIYFKFRKNLYKQYPNIEEIKMYFIILLTDHFLSNKNR